jgi:hypothetical protein
VPSFSPFIGRRRDFYIPTIPLNLKNIPSVNTHTNVFCISYIYKPATSSHAKPRLFETTTLTLLLADSQTPPFRKSSRAVTPKFVFHHIPEFHRFPKFVALQVHGFESLQIRDFGTLAGSRFRAITRSQLRGFEGSGLQITAHSRLPDFVSSSLQIFASSLPLKSCITNFINFDASRVTGFMNSPTLAPRGSGLTPTIRFHEHFRTSVKNVTLGTSEGTRITRKPCNGQIEARSQNYLPRPYK